MIVLVSLDSIAKGTSRFHYFKNYQQFNSYIQCIYMTEARRVLHFSAFIYSNNVFMMQV